MVLEFMTKPIEVDPFKLRNFLSDKCNQNFEELTTERKNGFSYKVKPILQQNQLSDNRKFEDFSCEKTFHIFQIKLKELFTYKTAISVKNL